MFLVLAQSVDSQQFVEVAESNNLKAAQIVAAEISKKFSVETFIRLADEKSIENAEFLEYLTGKSSHWIYQTQPVLQ
jgi:tRNA threonylcarbamoyladenosine modification (KEOPS) complex Cgi121 subunit